MFVAPWYCFDTYNAERRRTVIDPELDPAGVLAPVTM